MRPRRVAKGLLAAFLYAAVLALPPLFLWWLGGNPLPESVSPPEGWWDYAMSADADDWANWAMSAGWVIWGLTTVVLVSHLLSAATTKATAETQIRSRVWQAPSKMSWRDAADVLLGDPSAEGRLRAHNVGRAQPDGSYVTADTETIRRGWFIVAPPGAIVPSRVDRLPKPDRRRRAERETDRERKREGEAKLKEAREKQERDAKRERARRERQAAEQRERETKRERDRARREREREAKKTTEAQPKPKPPAADPPAAAEKDKKKFVENAEEQLQKLLRWRPRRTPPLGDPADFADPEPVTPATTDTETGADTQPPPSPKDKPRQPRPQLVEPLLQHARTLWTVATERHSLRRGGPKHPPHTAALHGTVAVGSTDHAVYALFDTEPAVKPPLGWRTGPDRRTWVLKHSEPNPSPVTQQPLLVPLGVSDQGAAFWLNLRHLTVVVEGSEAALLMRLWGGEETYGTVPPHTPAGTVLGMGGDLHVVTASDGRVRMRSFGLDLVSPLVVDEDAPLLSADAAIGASAESVSDAAEVPVADLWEEEYWAGRYTGRSPAGTDEQEREAAQQAAEREAKEQESAERERIETERKRLEAAEQAAREAAEQERLAAQEAARQAEAQKAAEAEEREAKEQAAREAEERERIKAERKRLEAAEQAAREAAEQERLAAQEAARQAEAQKIAEAEAEERERERIAAERERLEAAEQAAREAAEQERLAAQEAARQAEAQKAAEERERAAAEERERLEAAEQAEREAAEQAEREREARETEREAAEREAREAAEHAAIRGRAIILTYAGGPDPTPTVPNTKFDTSAMVDRVRGIPATPLDDDPTPTGNTTGKPPPKTKVRPPDRVPQPTRPGRGTRRGGTVTTRRGQGFIAFLLTDPPHAADMTGRDLNLTPLTVRLLAAVCGGAADLTAATAALFGDDPTPRQLTDLDAAVSEARSQRFLIHEDQDDPNRPQPLFLSGVWQVDWTEMVKAAESVQTAKRVRSTRSWLERVIGADASAERADGLMRVARNTLDAADARRVEVAVTLALSDK